MRKPKELLLPPEYIYFNEFHKMVYLHNNGSEVFNDKHSGLWFSAINKSCGYGKRIQDIKGFCQSIYGLCKSNHLLSAYLYFESAPDLPHHFFDKSYLNSLPNKYNSIAEYWQLNIKQSHYIEYILLSSRKTITGE